MAGKCGKVGLSANAWFGWNEEATYGTALGPNSASDFALPISESILETTERLAPPTVTQAHNDINQVYQGLTRVEGSVQMAVPYEGLETLWLHALGEINSGAAASSGTFSRFMDLSAGGRYKHATSPSLTLHASRGIVGSGSSLPLVFSYYGSVIDTLKLSAERGGALLAEFGVFGKNFSVATSSVSPSYPTAPIANFTECAVTWGSVEIPVSRFEINIAKGIDRERYFLGQTDTCEPPMSKWQVTGSLETEWDNEVRAGSKTLRQDYADGTDRELKFSFTSRTLIPGTTGQYYELDLVLPAALLGQVSPPITRQGRVLLTVPFTGYDDTIASAPHEFRMFQHGASNYTE
jgi:hypothetical protein